VKKHSLAITVLEHKAQEYRTIACNGQYRYGDPEDEIARWKEMAVQCDEAAEALKNLG
jgi:hypothetical protein